MRSPLVLLRTAAGIGGAVIASWVALDFARRLQERLGSRSSFPVTDRDMTQFWVGEGEILITVALIVIATIWLRGSTQCIALLALGGSQLISGFFAGAALDQTGLWLFWAGLATMSGGALAAIGASRPLLSSITGLLGGIVLFLFLWSFERLLASVGFLPG